MKTPIKIVLLFAILTFTTVLLTTCSLDKSQIDTGRLVKIIGKLNDEILGTKSISKVISGNVDKLWIIPIGDGDPYRMPEGLSSADYVNINSDGTFEVSVNTGISDNWVLLLLDSTQSDKKDQVLGYVTLGAGEDSLIKLPVSEALDNEINLGTLNVNGEDEVESSNTDEENANQFNFTVDQLKKIAKTDDMLRFVKNLYINYNKTSGIYYTVIPEFTFRDSQSMIENQWAKPEEIVSDSNFTTLGSLAFKTNDSPFTDGNNTGITLTPPGTVGIEDYENGSITPYDSNNPVPTNEHSNPFIEDGVFQVTFSYFSVATGFPVGYWALNKNGTTYAYFDINSTYPEDSNGYPKIYVPVLKANVDANNIITSIQIKWYVYDPSINPPYSEISGSDPAIQNSILHNEYNAITITIWAISGVSEEYIRPLNPEDTEVVPTKQWNYNWENPDENTAYGISIGYIMNGISYTFDWIPKSRLQT